MCDSDNPVTAASTYAVCPCASASRIAPCKAPLASSIARHGPPPRR